jgi:hypothetical protein
VEGRIAYWSPVRGAWKFDDDGAAIYFGSSGQEQSRGICISRIQLIEGGARTTTVTLAQAGTNRTETSVGLLYGYRSPNDEYLAIGLGGAGSTFKIERFGGAVGSQGFALQTAQAPTRQLHHDLEIRIHGRRIVLKADGIPVLEKVLDVPLPAGNFGLFASGDAPIAFIDTIIYMDPICLF